MRRKIEDKLIDWKNSQKRMPVLLYGARQVGKTYILQHFGETHFENCVYINFEINLAVASYFDNDISPERLIRFLESTYNQEIIPNKTLIIFDEIQACERALTALKYFSEQAPQYHIVAAGSLLGVAVNREQYSFPVGKVESLTLYPLDFEEFLWAMEENRLGEEIRSHYTAFEQAFLEQGNQPSALTTPSKDLPSPLPDALHHKALEMYHYYLIVGGMPACVKELVISKKLINVPNIQNEILNNYVADMAKYATASETVKLRACFNSLPAQLAKENKKFQYKIIQKGGSATYFRASIDWLEQAGLVLKCQRIDQGMSPISVYADLSAFKLYMGDVGLLTMKSGLPQQVILADMSNAFMGAVAENYIAQALTANNHALYYWTSEYSAELDFVLQKGMNIIGIEVKKGIKTKSKSLNVFREKYAPQIALRFSEKNFGISNQVFSVPHYAAFCV